MFDCLLLIILIIISVKDFIYGKYESYYQYIIFVLTTIIAISSNTFNIKKYIIILIIYLIYYHIYNNNVFYLDKYIGNGDIELIISFAVILNFYSIIILLALASLFAILYKVIEILYKKEYVGVVRFIPFLTLSFFIVYYLKLGDIVYESIYNIL